MEQLTDNQMLLAQHEGNPWLTLAGFLLIALTIYAYKLSTKNLED